MIDSGDEDGDGAANCADIDCEGQICDFGGPGPGCPPGEICEEESLCFFGDCVPFGFR